MSRIQGGRCSLNTRFPSNREDFDKVFGLISRIYAQLEANATKFRQTKLGFIAIDTEIWMADMKLQLLFTYKQIK
jgi:hypothetical protein